MWKIVPLLIVGIVVCSGFGASAISEKEGKTIPPSPYIEEYDMVVVAPSMFSEAIQPLIDHKNNIGIETFLKKTEEIFNEYEGRDEAEQIKYFIYESVENLGIDYVLLVGDVHTTPIRKTEVNHIWTASNIIQVDDIITDLYYADIYDSDGNFSSWDSNNDGVFSEFYLYNLGETPEEIEVVDEVDLYPDIGVGRIPCANVDELDFVVNKIITYETQSNDEWFHKIVLAAQDGSPEPGSQGEDVADRIAAVLPNFTPVKLYESMGNLHAISINREINDGAGFFICCAHGRHMAFANYHKVFINGLHNDNELPIAVLGGCFNAQLDASLHELLKEFGLSRIDSFFQFLHIDTKKLQSCIAWDFLRHDDGGSIATIGMTRKGTGESAGFFGIEFFESYTSGVTLSQMYNNAVTSFIDESWKDYVTLQMFILLGDPSLKIGGY